MTETRLCQDDGLAPAPGLLQKIEEELHVGRCMLVTHGTLLLLQGHDELVQVLWSH